MNLVTPEIGLVFWTTVSFLILLFILGISLHGNQF